MERFPSELIEDAGTFLGEYLEEYRRASATISRKAFAQAAEALTRAIQNGQTIFACGNGGSAAIANHLLCDHLKGIRTTTALRPKVISLSNSIELITAIANDFCFEDVFVYQLQSMARAGDVLFSISSSGNSENILRALQWCRENGVICIALSGFTGGRSIATADISLHAEAHNYGVVEDLHQSLMHALAQYIRHRWLEGKSPREVQF